MAQGGGPHRPARRQAVRPWIDGSAHARAGAAGGAAGVAVRPVRVGVPSKTTTVKSTTYRVLLRCWNGGVMGQVTITACIDRAIRLTSEAWRC